MLALMVPERSEPGGRSDNGVVKMSKSIRGHPSDGTVDALVVGVSVPSRSNLEK
jgi:hypothetical protein